MENKKRFENYAEKIAYLQFKVEEYFEIINNFERQVLDTQNNLSLDTKLKLKSMIENLKPEINDVVQN